MDGNKVLDRCIGRFVNLFIKKQRMKRENYLRDQLAPFDSDSKGRAAAVLECRGSRVELSGRQRV